MERYERCDIIHDVMRMYKIKQNKYYNALVHTIFNTLIMRDIFCKSTEALVLSHPVDKTNKCNLLSIIYLDAMN